MSETTVTSYVTYYFPGTFFSEESGRPVGSRDPRQAAVNAPETAFAFTFHDVATTTAEVDGQEVKLASRAPNQSGRFYIDAEKLTADDVAAMGDDGRILLSNMRGNNWPVMLRCRTGNYQPLTEADQVITSDGVLAGA